MRNKPCLAGHIVLSMVAAFAAFIVGRPPVRIVELIILSALGHGVRYSILRDVGQGRLAWWLAGSAAVNVGVLAGTAMHLLRDVDHSAYVRAVLALLGFGVGILALGWYLLQRRDKTAMPDSQNTQEKRNGV